ncbi:hypothetical protein M0R72_21190 [Candidatus Pacearchaeota archaeon]|jgi:hypothetical protein|nr:hypothetical protein [Candidatus Pacearchaeota archaeon]
MSRYILAGYRLCIEGNLKEVSTHADDGSIDIRPKSISMDRICFDKESMKKAIDDYFELESVER